MDPESLRDQAARILIQRLQSLDRAGVSHIARADEAAVAELSASLTVEKDKATEPIAQTTPADTAPDKQPAEAVPAKQQVAPPPTPPVEPVLGKGATLEQRRDALKLINAEVKNCTRCDELARTRTQTVFGVGNPMPQLVFLGEGPGADEDRQGEPFVGRAGKLLDKMIGAMSLSREEVYILNIVKCRPPGNRNPEPAEAKHCREYLDRQLAVLQPEYIVCLGAVAAQNLLNTTEAVGRLRGRFWNHGDAKVVVTYHPAYLLREESQKRKAWEDLQMLMKDMGLST